jgi:hypothetical protein
LPISSRYLALRKEICEHDADLIEEISILYAERMVPASEITLRIKCIGRYPTGRVCVARSRHRHVGGDGDPIRFPRMS